MIIDEAVYRRTIDNIENIYLLRCQPRYVAFWVRTRKRMFKKLIELQLKEFDRNDATQHKII